MKVSTKGRYALRVMVDLAMYAHHEYIPLKDIAKRQQISLKYLETIMRILTTSNFVYSAKGVRGGYKLARRADMYRVGDILRACEGNIVPLFCIEDKRSCERCCKCTTYSFWQGFSEHINEYLDRFTLQDIVNQNQPFDYII
ncbi:MAG: Rrf2 family transcriptional regulator [Erysipelotrichia bacterium]|nr:Rrf2 family transcriptional regulator [Erysipelotrichia bacterium]NCC55130.1 Rrf2 family transcriptional regulator [Erysipelotrichia bacterium]